MPFAPHPAPRGGAGNFAAAKLPQEEFGLSGLEICTNVVQPANYSSNLSPEGTVFKSPTTPASASSPMNPPTPSFRGLRSQCKDSFRRVPGASPLSQSMSFHESDLQKRLRVEHPNFSSPFFSQSSGFFVAPLESSCSSLFNYDYFLVLLQKQSQ
ncbi:hypothetical protein K431DRAFT_284489 [Polychaeton citri CBS 116435]|uniref:Uncharacterized protein n=1 Tax=Polychaeton citri CBS 116435 TaxID=1314669 RepID=A0A9P4QBA0_9PEZI|nr:hypothetical protein K431DRAFT_284489 [Polychaeton citri CBS 116435]